MSLSFSVKEETACIFNLKGNLIDKDSASELINTINDFLIEEKNHFILNFEEMDYINSTGLNVFISILTKIRNAGGELVICTVPKKINQLLLITKLNSIFTVADNLSHANQLLNKTQPKQNKTEL